MVQERQDPDYTSQPNHRFNQASSPGNEDRTAGAIRFNSIITAPRSRRVARKVFSFEKSALGTKTLQE
jgi:hypothetical protein